MPVDCGKTPFLIQISGEEVKTYVCTEPDIAFWNSLYRLFKFSSLRVIMVKSGERIRKRVTITTVYVRDYAVNPSYHYNTI